MKQPPLPSRVGRYEIVDRLGAGGMGVVYLATDPLLRRTVAIKVLPGGDDELRERFSREARSAASLRHNNVVTIYDVGEDDGQPFISMEFVDGESMSELIRRRAPLPVERRLQLLIELCAGLGHAHRSGIVHRDIKPGNLMITTDGVLKVLDFGLARVATTASQTGLTRAGAVMGTPHYMSPEQVEGQVVDLRSDIFAVGLVLYELLSYQKAFSGDSVPVVLHNIVHKIPTPIRSLVPTIDVELEQIVNQGLEKDPPKRYPSLSALADDLERVRDRLLDEGHGPTMVTPAPPETTGSRKPRNLDALAQRRTAQVGLHLAAAQSHFDAGSYDAAIQECENAIVIDPQESRALDLLDRAHRAVEDLQVAKWLEQARALLSSGELTRAEVLIDQSMKLRASLGDVQALQQEIQEKRKARELDAERVRGARSAIARARMHFEAGAFDAAARSATEALGYEADNAEARALKERAEASRQRVAADAVIAESRTRMAAGDGRAAITLLEEFRPQQLVASALGELQTELSRSQLPPRAKHDPVASASPPPTPTPTPTPTRWQGRALGLAAVLVLAVGGWILRPQAPTAPPAVDPAPAPAPVEQKPPPAAAVEPTPPAAAPSASAREQSSELRRDLAEAASGREGGPSRPSPPPAVRPSPSPSPFVARLAEAARVFEDGDYTRAVSMYRAILAEDPGNVAATTGLRDVTRAQSIEQKFTQPAALTPEQTRQLTRHLADAQQQQADGEYDSAITAYEAALRIDPNNTRATAGLAETRKAKAAEAAALSGLRKKPGQ